MTARARPRFTIPARVFGGYAVILVAFGALAIGSLIQHNRTASTLRVLHEGYLPLALALGRAEADAGLFGTILDRVLAERDTSASRSWIGTARRLRPVTIRRAQQGVARALTLGPSADDRALLSQLERELDGVARGYDAGDARYDALFRALEATDEARAQDELLGLRSDERRVELVLRDARDSVQDRIALLSAEAAEQEAEATVMLGVLSILALLVGIAVTWGAATLLAPLSRLSARVQEIAKGDLSNRLELGESRAGGDGVIGRDDELGKLATEIERMVDALRARDVSLRDAHEAQLRLRQMQEQIVADLRAAVLVLGHDGVVQLRNPAAERLLALGPESVGSTLSGTGLAARVDGLDGAIRSVTGGASRAILAAVAVSDSAAARTLNLLVTPFGARSDAGAGSAGGVLVVAEDVTEELRTKARLIQTERLAAMGKMAAHVTHEVRNPLSSIGLNVEMLEEEIGASGPETHALVRAIAREVDHLTAITEEYLRLARIPEPDRAPESPAALVNDVAAFVRREMADAGIELRVVLDPALPVVAMDEGQLRQALLNLLRNAREAMPRGGVITLEARRAERGAVLRVADEGVGIPAADRERIFDLFYTTKERGTGLGLSLTQQIVAAHGGAIRCVGREPGPGTAFEITLPELDATMDDGGNERMLDA